MRSGKLLTVLGLVLMLGVALAFIGCGDDDETPTTPTGSLTDPEFMAVQEQIDLFVDSTIEFIENGFGTMNSISSGDVVDPIYYGPGFPDTNTYSTQYTDGWNIINLSMNGNGFSYGIIDSVQFFRNNQAQQNGGDADSLYFRHKWQLMYGDTVNSYANFEGYSGFDFRGLQTAEATIDGVHYLNINVKNVTADSTVWANYYFNAEVSNLVIQEGYTGWDNSCPTSGMITSTVEVSYQKDQDTAIEATWDVVITFTNGAMAVSVQNGNTVWTYDQDICTPVNTGS